MTNRLQMLALTLWVSILAASPIRAQQPGPVHAGTPGTQSSSNAPLMPAVPPITESKPSAAEQAPVPPGRREAVYPSPPEPMEQWLDEVRAQRRAWEERRQAKKDAIDARRRRIDPWGAAHKDAVAQEAQRRRDALRDQIERDREAFRSSPRRATQPDPLYQEPPAPPTGIPALPDDQNDAPGSSYPPLPGWDNRWYYRGF